MVKRAAEKQITKDDADAGEADNGAPVQGGFSRAAPEVLRTRRILKVRRTVTPNASNSGASVPASNPFALLVNAPASSALNPFAKFAEPKEPASEEETPAEKAPVTPDAAAPPEPALAESAPSNDAAEDTSKNETEESSKDEKAVPAADAKPEEGGQKEAVKVEKDDTKIGEESDVKAVDASVKDSAVEKVTEPASAEKPAKVKPDADKKEEGDVKENGVEPKPETEKRAAPASGEKVERCSTKRAPFVFGDTLSATTSFADAASTKETGFSFLPKVTKLETNGNGAASSFVGTPKSKTSSYTEQSVKNGEEDEQTSHRVRSKVFSLEEGKWRENGVGMLKLNVYEGGARLLLRVEATLRLALNAPLYNNMTIDRAGERGIRFKDVSSDTVYLCRVPSKDEANALVDAIQDEVDKLSAD